MDAESYVVSWMNHKPHSMVRASIRGRHWIRAIVAVLRQVHDPEVPVNICDLELIYRSQVDVQGDVSIDMTLTSPAWNWPGCSRPTAGCKAARSGGRPWSGPVRIAVLDGITRLFGQEQAGDDTGRCEWEGVGGSREWRNGFLEKGETA